jgi:DNA-binding NtrC family response regulator
METASHKRAVLIVDDEKNIRLTLSQALEATGRDIDSAASGEEALAKLQGKPYGLILLDLTMPGMDGMAVLRRVREARPEIKAIIMTAFGTIESAVEAMKLGAVDFIKKPFAPNEIRELVTRVLDRDRLHAEKAKGYEMHIELAKKCITERRLEAAREHAQQAIAADATKPEAFNLLGVLLEIGGKDLEAQNNYRAALALDPTYKPASENLSRPRGLASGATFNLGPEKRPKAGQK